MEPRLTGGESKRFTPEKIVYIPYESRDVNYSIWEQIIAMETVASILGRTWEAIKDRHQYLEQT